MGTHKPWEGDRELSNRIFLCLVILVLLSGVSEASQVLKIQADPHLIKLVTDYSTTTGRLDYVGGDESYTLQGELHLALINPENFTGVRIRTRANGFDGEDLLWSQISLQYRVVWNDLNSSDWSEWISFAELPFTISIIDPTQLVSATAKPDKSTIDIYIQFRVPTFPSLHNTRQGKNHMAHLLAEYVI